MIGKPREGYMHIYIYIQRDGSTEKHRRESVRTREIGREGVRERERRTSRERERYRKK